MSRFSQPTMVLPWAAAAWPYDHLFQDPGLSRSRVSFHRWLKFKSIRWKTLTKTVEL